MVLRKAKLEDFEIFKQLYEDKENLYQFLYNSSKKEDTTIDTTIVSEFQWIIDESIIELYNNYTIDRFKKDLESSTLLYIIEDSSKIIGYVSMFYCSAGKYKIAEWAMLNPDDEQKKVEVLDCLKKLKLPRLRKFSICTVNDDVVKFLLMNGFSSSCCTFYELEI